MILYSKEASDSAFWKDIRHDNIVNTAQRYEFQRMIRCYLIQKYISQLVYPLAHVLFLFVLNDSDTNCLLIPVPFMFKIKGVPEILTSFTMNVPTRDKFS